MAEDAKRRQGRLAERPLKDGKEARALKILLDAVDQRQSSHRSTLKVINHSIHPIPGQWMAVWNVVGVLTGEFIHN